MFGFGVSFLIFRLGLGDIGIFIVVVVFCVGFFLLLFFVGCFVFGFGTFVGD